LRGEAEKFHEAQSTTRQAAKELAEIEEDILDEQAADSPYKQGLKKVEQARQNLKQVEERIVGESAVQAKLAGLSGNSLSEAKNKIFEFDDSYQAAKGELSAQGSGLAKIRSELFQADKHWKEAAESLTQARKDEKEAEGNTHGGASGRVGLNLKAKNAGEAAATAKAAIAQAEAVLRANGAGNLINNNSSANNSRSSGKKSNK
jgi:septation ring formation regulator EzrA